MRRSWPRFVVSRLTPCVCVYVCVYVWACLRLRAQGEPTESGPGSGPPDLMAADAEAGLGRKRERDSETAGGGAEKTDAAATPQPDGLSPVGTPTGTPGLGPQKKPRLTFGGGLRGIAAQQALEMKKNEPNSPAASAVSSPHLGAGQGGQDCPSPLGGLDDASQEEGQRKLDNKPKLVFPPAASSKPGGTPAGDKPKLTFGGGLGAAGGAGSCSAAASPGRGGFSPRPESGADGADTPKPGDAKPKLTFGGGLRGAGVGVGAGGGAGAGAAGMRPRAVRGGGPGPLPLYISIYM